MKDPTAKHAERAIAQETEFAVITLLGAGGSHLYLDAETTKHVMRGLVIDRNRAGKYIGRIRKKAPDAGQGIEGKVTNNQEGSKST